MKTVISIQLFVALVPQLSTRLQKILIFSALCSLLSALCSLLFAQGLGLSAQGSADTAAIIADGVPC